MTPVVAWCSFATIPSLNRIVGWQFGIAKLKGGVLPGWALTGTTAQQGMNLSQLFALMGYLFGI